MLLSYSLPIFPTKQLNLRIEQSCNREWSVGAADVPYGMNFYRHKQFRSWTWVVLAFHQRP